jgi:hypothetical protein
MGSGAGGSNLQRTGAVFYRFTDAKGTVHVVDSMDRVPMADRARAERVQYDNWTPVNGEQAHPQFSSLLHRADGLSGWQMFGLGAATVLLMTLLFRLLPGARGTLLRLAVVLGIAALLGGAYLGWARRAAHQSNDLLASPGTLIEDAKGAVEKMNARVKEQETQLKEAEQTK